MQVGNSREMRSLLLFCSVKFLAPCSNLTYYSKIFFSTGVAFECLVRPRWCFFLKKRWFEGRKQICSLPCHWKLPLMAGLSSSCTSVVALCVSFFPSCIRNFTEIYVCCTFKKRAVLRLFEAENHNFVCSTHTVESGSVSLLTVASSSKSGHFCRIQQMLFGELLSMPPLLQLHKQMEIY